MDLWAFDGTTLTDITPSGTKPPTGSVNTLVWDTKANRALLFGGSADFHSGRNELWQYSGGAWTQLSPTGTLPSARWDHAAAWDPLRNRMLVFGGTTTANSSGHLRDTWAFDGTSWTELSPSGDLPSARVGPCPVWDSRVGRMLLFGGESAVGDHNDLWAFDGVSWQQISPQGTPPSARAGMACSFDQATGRLLVFGGGSPPGLTALNDTWAYDGARWEHLTPSGALPSARWGSKATWDAARERMVMFGGFNNAEHNLNDLWTLEFAMVRVPAGPFMMGCNEAVDCNCDAREHPYHQVTLSAFDIDRTEVTQAAYRSCVIAGQCTVPGTAPATCSWNVSGGDLLPVSCIGWDQARAYCE